MMIALQYKCSTMPTEKILSDNLFKEVIMVLTEKIEAPRSSPLRTGKGQALYATIKVKAATALAKHFQWRTEKKD